jgi:hypothetical protein
VSPAQTELNVLPRRELLEALVRHYHQLRNEHVRSSQESRLRRRLEDRLLDVQERFERALAEWVRDDALAAEWRSHLHNRRPEPDGPPPIHPLVFRGVNEAGAVAEVRRRNSELDVTVDGTLAARLSMRDFPRTGDPGRFRVADTVFEETFTASAAALDALAAFLEQAGPPPWDEAVELLGDGLVDAHFALTPRGRRALARRQ